MARPSSVPPGRPLTGKNAATATYPHHPSTAALLLTSARPEQWTKNLIVFAGLLFGGRLFDVQALATALAAFVIFCVLSGAVYTFNDLTDREVDQRHPLKRLRPVASGQLSPRTALMAAVALAAGSIGAAASIRPGFAVIAGAYLALL